MERSHRCSWRLFRGIIPINSWVLHKCDNPSCVNPDHLFLGDVQDNHNDMHYKNRYKNGRIILTKDDIKYIINYPKSYGYANDLAIKFNISIGRVYNIRSLCKKTELIGLNLL